MLVIVPQRSRARPTGRLTAIDRFIIVTGTLRLWREIGVNLSQAFDDQLHLVRRAFEGRMLMLARNEREFASVSAVHEERK
jgi:hypothetical protein